MCGRYTEVSDLKEVVTALGVDEVIASLTEPRYNIAPTQLIVAVSARDKVRELDLFNWGLQPNWGGTTPPPSSLINARVESITEKPSFREAVKYRRCLIPASGWYEWQSTIQTAGRKQPYYFFSEQQPILAFAGIYEVAADNTKTAAIITQPANEVVAKVHSRMPLILSLDFFAAWLDPTQTNSKLAVEIARVALTPQLVSHPVSPAVNSARAQGSELILPSKPEPTQPALFE
jgi:putative SOS response-associated peptidase YedK